MSILKFLLGDITLDVDPKKIGHLFNNTAFNVSSSAFSLGVTGVACVKAAGKAFVSPSMPCKLLYGASAGLNAISCTSSALCLLSRYSSVAPIPVVFGTIGYVTSYAGRVCNTIGDCVNPTSELSSKAVDTCIDEITKGF